MVPFGSGNKPQLLRCSSGERVRPPSSRLRLHRWTSQVSFFARSLSLSLPFSPFFFLFGYMAPITSSTSSPCDWIECDSLQNVTYHSPPSPTRSPDDDGQQQFMWPPSLFLFLFPSIPPFSHIIIPLQIFSHPAACYTCRWRPFPLLLHPGRWLSFPCALW